jgi:bifunctional non-homologous end joining protein LigD
MARLTEYRKKRDFTITSEPSGEGGVAHNTRRFVVQKHAATRLHYDLRLELEGVYKSWAVTKVPSLDPAVRRLAVEVEDHPLDYGTFEGTIPKGQYGGGTVLLWDNGSWTPQTDEPAAQALADGHLKFELSGQRLKGRWALVRMRDEEARRGRKVRHNWLLIKEKDAVARPGDADSLLSQVTSAKTGRTMDEIAAGKPARKNPPRRPASPARKKAAAKPRAKRVRS